MVRQIGGLGLVLLLSGWLHAAPPLHIAQDGLVVMEVESHPPVGRWLRETAVSGFTGESYYRFSGRGDDALIYRFVIIEPGDYQLRIRNHHDHEDSTLENDCFTSLDGGPLVKTFSSHNKVWTWHSMHEFDHSNKKPARYELMTGEHVLVIRGRSANFRIDRIHLYRDGRKESESESLPPTLGGPAPQALPAIPKVEQAWRDGQFGAALIAAERLAMRQDGSEAAQQAAIAIRTLTEGANQLRDQASELIDRDPVAAMTLIDAGASLYRSTTPGAQMRELAMTWRAKPEVSEALAAHQIVTKMMQTAAPLRGQGTATDAQFARQHQGELTQILSGYRLLKSRYPKTSAFARADRLVRELGLPTD